jgi:serine/threonine-protein kinase
VIHRDIKPANILLHDSQPVVADFGIALALGAAGGGRLTETGLSLGTPHYMSPEQATGDTGVGLASDIYALGCVLYEMLVGERPHTGSTPQAILGRIVMHDADTVSAHRRSVPANVDAAVGMALEQVPADRFASAADFAAALGDAAFEGRARVAGAARGGSRRLTLALGAAFAAAVMLAAWGWLRPTPSMPVTRFATELPLGDPRALRASRPPWRFPPTAAPSSSATHRLARASSISSGVTIWRPSRWPEPREGRARSSRPTGRGSGSS